MSGQLSQNHLEGRTAAFFCYGDGGADELDGSGRPRALRHPAYFDPEEEPFDRDRDAYAPLVWQCRYSGIEVPERLWRYQPIGERRPYSENQAEHLDEDGTALEAFDDWTRSFAEFVGRKGKVEPGEHRAYGHHRPGHLWRDVKLKWRELRMSLGRPREGSSPAAQQEQGLNRDQTLTPKEGEGEKLRRGGRADRPDR